MGGLISSDTLEHIRAANDIVEVISGYLPLKRAGANFLALCPFHKEKTPSFHVSSHKQFFYCYGCHKGGDVFKFVTEYEGIGFMDAVRRLAERARIPLELDEQPGQKQSRHLKDQLLQIHEQITQRWQVALTNDAAGQIARDYLAKRGVSAEAISLFRLGYAPESWEDTVNWSRSKGFEPGVMEQSGLIVRKEGTDRYYDRFRGRLMFPICDEQGRVIGFSGRVLSGDEKTAKYVNSPESPIFTKGKVMFGLDKSKRAMLDTRRAVICEGQLDLIASFMAGVKNIVAPQGTALTSDHARILKRYVEEVVLCFDSDNAGQNAAVRSLDSLLAAGLAVRVAPMPAPHDPDSFIKENGGAAFQKLIDSAPGFFDYYLDRLCKVNDLGSDRGRHTVVQGMTEALHKTGSEVLLDTYAQKTALRLGVSADAVRKEFSSKVQPSIVSEGEEAVEDVPQSPPPSVPETWLVGLLFEKDEFAEWVDAHLDMEWIIHPDVRGIIASRLEAYREDSWRGVAAWLTQLENPQWQSLVTGILAKAQNIPDPEGVLKGALNRDGIVKRLRDDHIDKQLAALNQRLGMPVLTDEERVQTLTQIQQLRVLKRSPLQAQGE